ncbi:hypothetical protein M011DRAFT_472907 [Sporormia fimetaria CBS 119925]|uniref:Uncharacterized protein n=1 Tax=Sporormia fimetaria CBS 119925 TaxID=1340428 RepID=A0A6A6UU32_9PLEO|nr:hypothetical protein M011DRAFT_472907 [Sporormia fimetaria CBS 119925]
MTPKPVQEGAQQKGAPSGLPNVPHHFWAPTNAAYWKIQQINDDLKASAAQTPGTGASSHKRPVTNMWSAICNLFYPADAVVTNGPVWSVDVETAEEEDMPDSLIIRTLLETAPWTRDYGRIECVKAAHDNARGWQNLISNTVTLLTESQADSTTNDNSISLVLAVGTKCMLFIWDPKSKLPGEQLRIRGTAEDGTGDEDAMLDPRIKPPPFDTSYIDSTAKEVIWSAAWKLDHDTDPETGAMPHLQEMEQIEKFLCSIREIPLAEKEQETTRPGPADDLKPKV